MRVHTMKRLVIILYEVFMISLVIFSLVYTWLGIGGAGKLFVKIMWMIFLVDVVARFVATKGKWKYLKENPFDVVSVIPLEDSLLLARFARRSEEHTSELQSRGHLVCRLLLEK